jgi:dTDP-4-amino-4,6-dideoxygalactose transaminase
VELLDLGAQQRRLGGRIEEAVARVLAHRRFVDGPEVAELEDALGRYCGVAHAVACASGTDALVLALLALGLKPGDHVAVPAFTFAATAEAVALLGGVPVFADVDPVTFNVDPASLATAFGGAAGSRIVGVIPVDLFGQPADHDEIAAIANAHGAWVLTDAAQSFGSAVDGRRAGSLGTMAATSFFPAKPLGCYGDGGAVFTNDGDLAAAVRSLRGHGAGADRYEHVRIGMTGRLDTIQAAVLLAKLTVFDEELDARDALARRYGELLEDVVAVPRVRAGRRSAWAQYTCVLDDRDTIAKRMAEEGVPTSVHYPRPLHRQPAYRRFPVVPGGAPAAEELAASVLSLPMHPYLSRPDQDRVVAALRAAVEA